MDSVEEVKGILDMIEDQMDFRKNLRVGEPNKEAMDSLERLRATYRAKLQDAERREPDGKAEN
ncbi:MAG: hypothetical protein ACYTEQ_01295 [Planctomycetota bacterium]|jgi:hypothetical protein